MLSVFGASQRAYSQQQGQDEVKTEAVLETTKRAYGVNQITLLGDARVQAISDEATSSFGGGIRYISLDVWSMFVIRTGATSSALASSRDAGQFVLMPTSVGSPSVHAELRFFFCIEGAGFAHWEWLCGKGAGRRFTSDVHHGIRLYINGAEANWEAPNPALTLESQQGTTTTKGNATMIGAGYITRRVFSADKVNFISMEGYLGGVVGVLGGDVVNSDNSEACESGGIRNCGSDPAARLLESDQTVFPGLEFGGSLRIGAMILGATLVSLWDLEDPAVPGLTGIQYVITAELQDGPSIPTDD